MTTNGVLEIRNTIIIRTTIQTLFTSIGCDCISFFSEIGKSLVFFEQARFIFSHQKDSFATHLTHINLHELANSSLLAFLFQEVCGAGCQCTNCCNTNINVIEMETDDYDEERAIEMDYDEERMEDDDYDILEDDVENIMESIFGSHYNYPPLL